MMMPNLGPSDAICIQVTFCWLMLEFLEWHVVLSGCIFTCTTILNHGLLKGFDITDVFGIENFLYIVLHVDKDIVSKWQTGDA